MCDVSITKIFWCALFSFCFYSLFEIKLLFFWGFFATSLWCWVATFLKVFCVWILLPTAEWLQAAKIASLWLRLSSSHLGIPIINTHLYARDLQTAKSPGFINTWRSGNFRRCFIRRSLTCLSCVRCTPQTAWIWSLLTKARWGYLSPHTFTITEVSPSTYNSWLSFVTQIVQMTVRTQEWLD